jgi:hypothetical protein
LRQFHIQRHQVADRDDEDKHACVAGSGEAQRQKEANGM